MDTSMQVSEKIYQAVNLQFKCYGGYENIKEYVVQYTSCKFSSKVRGRGGGEKTNTVYHIH
jgi:hypothetical protein